MVNRIKDRTHLTIESVSTENAIEIAQLIQNLEMGWVKVELKSIENQDLTIEIVPID